MKSLPNAYALVPTVTERPTYIPKFITVRKVRGNKWRVRILNPAWSGDKS